MIALEMKILRLKILCIEHLDSRERHNIKTPVTPTSSNCFSLS